MGTEDWVFKGTKLITNTKKQRLKIQSGGWIFKITILKKRRRKEKKKSQELFKKKTTTTTKIFIYEVCFKNLKIKKMLKLKKEKEKKKKTKQKKRMIVKIVKVYLGLSLVLLWEVWGHFIFRQFLGLAYIS